MKLLIPCACVALLAYSSAWADKRQHVSTYERGVNDALNMTLLVLADEREQHRRPTWQQIQTQVALRLKVHRKEPWTQ